MSVGEFTFDRILDARLDDGQWMFRMKWQGYDDASSTWEPAANVPETAQEDFWRTHKMVDYIDSSRFCFVPTNSLELTTAASVHEIRAIFPPITRREDVLEIIKPVKRPGGSVAYWVLVQQYDRPVLIPSSRLRRLNPEMLLAFFESNATLS
jgi:hypothetical protein